MADALERLVNLALYLAAAHGPVTAEEVRTEVGGYPPDQDHDAFLRMFERDKEDLRAAGLAIEVVDSETAQAYRLDSRDTYAAEVELSEADVAVLRAVGAALTRDEGFPYADDLALALAKTMPGVEAAPRSAARIADEDPSAQGVHVAELTAAARARKRVRFGYTNALGEAREHEAEPYGLFLREGRWYLVARDVGVDDVRVYAVSRMDGVRAESKRPKTPDFERPAAFDVLSYVAQPFQYGPGEPFEALVRFDPAHAWRAPALTAGAGSLSGNADGSVDWTVDARDRRRLARWTVEHGPGIGLVAPPSAVEELRTGLAATVAAHER